MTPLDAFVGLLIGILGNLGTDALAERRRRLERKKLDWEQANLRAKSLREQLKVAIESHKCSRWAIGPDRR